MLKIFDELEILRIGKSLGIPRAEGEALYTFIKEHNIKTVVETGVAWGFTSCYILAALPQDGMLISIEPRSNADIGSVVPNEYKKKWRIVQGTSARCLVQTFREHPGIDMFFHDSDHSRENQTFEYETAWPYVKFVGSHDISFHGPIPAWTEFKNKHNLRAALERGELGICQIR